MNTDASLLSIPTFLKKHLVILIVGLAAGAFIHLIASGNTEVATFYPYHIQYLFAGCVGITATAIFYFNNGWLNKFLPWTKGAGKRLLFGLAVNFILLLLLLRVLEFLLLLEYPSDLFSSYRNKLVLLGFIATLIYSIIYFALVSYYSYSQKKLDTIQVRREQVDLQYQALKSQLSPHFLFNGLNTMSALVNHDPVRSKSFIRHFANCYKFVLKNYKSDLITVEQELEFVKAYVYLLQTRHNNNIELESSISQKTMKSWVPPLAIQMLVENAAKHNQISNDYKLKINITEKNNQLIIKNNKTKAPIKTSSFKIGLNNILKRYGLMGHDSFQIIDEQEFIVKLPCILKR